MRYSNSVDTQKFKKASNIYNNRCINISRFVKQKFIPID